MNCPFCGKEATSGTIRFDGRSPLRWIEGDTQKSRTDRFWDFLAGVGNLTAAEYHWPGSGTIQGNYCSFCKKMIIDTDISK